MSQHVVEQDGKRFVFGWDPPVQTFFLQVHDLSIEDEDERIISWLGTDPDKRMPGIGVILEEAQKHGLVIDGATRMALYDEKRENI